MSFEPKQEDTGGSPIIEAKSLLLEKHIKKAFAVLKKGAKNGDVMACFDCGFMMIQGIGCEKNLERGLKLMRKGLKLAKKSKEVNWKSDGSVSELFEPQLMNLDCMFLFDECDLESPHFIINSHIDLCDSP